MTVNVGIIGAAGRMGRMLVQTVEQDAGCVLVGATVHKDDPLKGQDAGDVAGIGHIGVSLTSDIVHTVAAADVLIDFTTPAATLEHCLVIHEYGKALVAGTTGFSDAQMDKLRQHAAAFPLLWSSNMSMGVAILAELTERVAKLLDNHYDIEIIEAHHRHKVDAPSGTALTLGEAAARGRAVTLADAKVSARDGITGARREGSIGFSVIRGGDIVGDHTVLFASDGERIELTHKASNRAIFARGAVHAAKWLKGQPSGFYGVRDALKLF